MSAPPVNPCLTCGACCAYYRCSFYWGETDAAPEGTVPADLTHRVSAFLVAMNGTEGPRPRCVALGGTIGEEVRCTIYEQRSTSCREFPFAWQDGLPNERCDKARIAHGLLPLPPAGFEPHPPALVEFLEGGLDIDPEPVKVVPPIPEPRSPIPELRVRPRRTFRTRRSAQRPG